MIKNISELPTSLRAIVAWHLVIFPMFGFFTIFEFARAFGSRTPEAIVRAVAVIGAVLFVVPVIVTVLRRTKTLYSAVVFSSILQIVYSGMNIVWGRPTLFSITLIAVAVVMLLLLSRPDTAAYVETEAEKAVAILE